MGPWSTGEYAPRRCALPLWARIRRTAQNPTRDVEGNSDRDVTVTVTAYGGLLSSNE